MVAWGAVLGMVLLGAITGFRPGKLPGLLFWGGLLGASAGWWLRTIIGRMIETEVRERVQKELQYRPFDDVAVPRPAQAAPHSHHSQPDFTPDFEARSTPAVSGSVAPAQPEAQGRTTEEDLSMPAHAEIPATETHSFLATQTSPVSEDEEYLFDIAWPLEAPSAPVHPSPRPPASLSGKQRHARKGHENSKKGEDHFFLTLLGWFSNGNILVRVGVVVLFLGLAFLAKYAIDRGFIPMELRLAGIAAVGFALFMVGWRIHGKREDKRIYALTLEGAGMAVMYLTAFSTYSFQMVPAQGAFVLMFAISATTAAVALRQNAQSIAVVALAGGFAVPLLISSDLGNYVGLFSCYLILNAGIALMAYRRAWRSLNLLGFVATFGVYGIWYRSSFQTGDLPGASLFLGIFFLLYVAVGYFYAMRHSLKPRLALDGVLIYGTPLLTFALLNDMFRHGSFPAWLASLLMGTFYFALCGFTLSHRVSQRASAKDVQAWLGESWLILGIAFATLSVPLALDNNWTASVWALEGLALYWTGLRQQRWLVRLSGLALQFMGAASWLYSLNPAQPLTWPLQNPGLLASILLALCAGTISWWIHHRFSAKPSHHAAPDSLERLFLDSERALATPMFWLGFVWWMATVLRVLGMHYGSVAGEAIFAPYTRCILLMLAYMACARVCMRLALRHPEHVWPAGMQPAHATAFIMLGVAVSGWIWQDESLIPGTLLAWLAACVLHVRMLHQLDQHSTSDMRPLMHAAGIWALVLLCSNILWRLADKTGLPDSFSWKLITLLAAPIAALALLVWLMDPAKHKPRSKRWPLNRFADAYFWLAALPIAVAAMSGSLILAVSSSGHTPPLPYIPLLNPVDLSVLACTLACMGWLVRLHQAGHRSVSGQISLPQFTMFFACIGFVLTNTIWLRTAHHFAGVPWDAATLFRSPVVQTGYAILWTLLAIPCMAVAHRCRTPALWMGGAALLALTVLKLFVVDLSNTGSSERIVAFIIVGALIVVIGYFIPMPDTGKKGKTKERKS